MYHEQKFSRRCVWTKIELLQGSNSLFVKNDHYKALSVLTQRRFHLTAMYIPGIQGSPIYSNSRFLFTNSPRTLKSLSYGYAPAVASNVPATSINLFNGGLVVFLARLTLFNRYQEAHTSWSQSLTKTLGLH